MGSWQILYWQAWKIGTSSTEEQVSLDLTENTFPPCQNEEKRSFFFFFLTCSLHKLTRDYERRFVMTSKYLRGRLWVNPQWVLVKYPDCTYWTITAADGITGRKSTAHPISTFVNKLWKQFLFLAKTKHKKKQTPKTQGQ